MDPAPAASVDVDSPLARALRALQRYDEGAGLCGDRLLLVEALTLLGDQLGLACTGVAEGGGFYDHGGDTCPIHEWLVEADAEPEAVPNLKGLR